MKRPDNWANLGTRKNEVQIVPYDPEWPDIFQTESQRIREVCDPSELTAIEHIGSTSIVGMPAKPIIDIMLGVENLDQVQNIIRVMQNLGYENLGEFGVPGRLFFVLADNGSNLIHCHLFQVDSWQWRRHLFFRDQLRTNPQLAKEYLTLKEELAQRFRHDRRRYSEEKTRFVTLVEKGLK